MSSPGPDPLHAGDEEALIALCRAGDPLAWDLLFDRHYDATGRFIFQVMPGISREDVQEICQETFLAVIRHLSRFNGRSRLQTWVFRIAANKARDYVERRRAAKRGSGQVPVSLQSEDPETGRTLDPPSPAPGPDTQLLTQERHACLRQSLTELGDPCREIIELRYFGDLSYEEIGASLHLNLKTVSSRLSKCLDKLEVLARKHLVRESSAPTSV